MVGTDTLTLTSTMKEAEKEENGVPAYCIGCGLMICDRFMLSVFPDLRWHVTCLKCAECQQNRDESHTCFIKDGKTLCKDDYIRFYTTKCAKCRSPFSSHNYVMRAEVKVYHVRCFCCERCDRQLLPGDEFTIRGDFLHCTGHDSSRHGLITPPPYSVHVTDLARCDEGADTSCSSNRDDSGWLVAPIKSEKAVRVRTTLNKSQLHVLLTCYRANPRPDASLKERLMEMTGLSLRVIRIWFQNKQCKDKKRNMLERETQHKSGEQIDKPDNPVSTVTPENLGVNPLDLQTLQQSWKLLTSLLNSDIDDALNQDTVTLH